jgi:hypothetical protein
LHFELQGIRHLFLGEVNKIEKQQLKQSFSRKPFRSGLSRELPLRRHRFLSYEYRNQEERGEARIGEGMGDQAVNFGLLKPT